MLPTAALDERGSSSLSILFIDCSSWRMSAYHLLRVEQRLNTFCRKGCPGRDACCLNLFGAYLATSLAQRTVCSVLWDQWSHSLCGESWSRAPGQESGQEKVNRLLSSCVSCWGFWTYSTIPSFLAWSIAPHMPTLFCLSSWLIPAVRNIHRDLNSSR